MKKMTEANVKDALAGESQAHIKYLAFAEKAAAEKLPNAARLFKAASFSEQVHATNHLKTLGGVGATKDNLDAAAGGEGFEVDEMYPAYLAVAQAQGEKTAETYLNAALQAEKVHLALYQAAKRALAAGRDAAGAPVHVCSMCGFTMEGEAPSVCPVCGSARSPRWMAALLASETTNAVKDSSGMQLDYQTCRSSPAWSRSWPRSDRPRAAPGIASRPSTR